MISGDRSSCPYRFGRDPTVYATSSNGSRCDEKDAENSFDGQARTSAGGCVDVIISGVDGKRGAVLDESDLLLIDHRHTCLFALPAGKRLIAGASHGEEGCWLNRSALCAALRLDCVVLCFRLVRNRSCV